MVLGGIVFALVGDFEDGEFPRFITELARSHHLVLGFKKSIKVAPELVIENAFDAAHFPPVHDVRKITQEKPTLENGVFTARSTLYVAPSAWQGKDASDDDSIRIEVPLHARAFSPNLTVTAIAPGGEHPHYVIAGAVPQADGNCTIRLSIALQKQPGDNGPNMSVAELLLQFEDMGLEQDRPVWENLTRWNRTGSRRTRQSSITVVSATLCTLKGPGEAYEAYLKGRYFMNTYRVNQALEQYELAIKTDPNFALAYTGLADNLHVWRGPFFPATEVMPKAKAAAEKALQLDDPLVEAHTSPVLSIFGTITIGRKVNASCAARSHSISHLPAKVTNLAIHAGPPNGMSATASIC